MDTLLSVFLLFVAAITALLTYLITPTMSAMSIVTVAAGLLALGVWWHWSQFASDYRTSTWQEQLRDYASYALLVVIILCAYAFYAFGLAPDTMSSLVSRASSAAAAATNAGRRAYNSVRRSTASNTSIEAVVPTAGVVSREPEKENEEGILM